MCEIKRYWVLTGLLLALAGCNQGTPSSIGTGTENKTLPAEVTKPEQPVPAFVRTVHTASGIGVVALAVDGQKVTSNLNFGSASDFIAIQDTKVRDHGAPPHYISVIGADGKTLGGPQPLSMERGEDITIIIGGTAGKVTLRPFEHTNRGAAPKQAKVAVLHADPKLPEISVAVDGKDWTGDLSYGEASGYWRLAPGTHTLTVRYDKSHVSVVGLAGQPSAAPLPPLTVQTRNVVTLTQPLNLQADKVYSVIAYADAEGLPGLHLLEDKFGPELARAPEINPDAGVTSTPTPTPTPTD